MYSRKDRNLARMLGYIVTFIAIFFGSLTFFVSLVPSEPAAALQNPISTITLSTVVDPETLGLKERLPATMVSDLNNNGKPDPGDTVRYTIEYRNPSREEKNFNLVEDYEQIAIASITNITDNGRLDDKEGTITWTIKLPSRKEGSVSYDATFKSSFPPNGSLRVVNTATIPPSPTDIATATTITEITAATALDLRIPNLKLSKTWELTTDANSNKLPDPGDTITYKITLRNDGDVEAVKVSVRDNFKQDILGQPTAISGNGLNNGDVIVWDYPILNPGDEKVNTYQFDLTIALPVGISTVENTVSVISQATTEFTSKNSFTIDIAATITATNVPTTPAQLPTTTPEPSFKPAGPTGEQISASAQMMLAVSFMFLSLVGILALASLSHKEKPISSSLRDGFILSLVMGTVIILGLAGSVERSAIAGLIGTVAGYVLRGVVDPASRNTPDSGGKTKDETKQ